MKNSPGLSFLSQLQRRIGSSPFLLEILGVIRLLSLLQSLSPVSEAFSPAWLSREKTFVATDFQAQSTT